MAVFGVNVTTTTTNVFAIEADNETDARERARELMRHIDFHDDVLLDSWDDEEMFKNSEIDYIYPIHDTRFWSVIDRKGYEYYTNE